MDEFNRLAERGVIPEIPGKKAGVDYDDPANCRDLYEHRRIGLVRMVGNP